MRAIAACSVRMCSAPACRSTSRSSISPGGYVCGEQGALIEAIEERRAEPRNRPPQLETNGLFDKPTLLSNVETFAWVPAIALQGGKWYAESGRKGGPWYTAKGKPGAAGLRFFSVCGDVRKPGVFEVEIGSTLGELIDLAGGLRDGLPLKAVAPLRALRRFHPRSSVQV